MYMHIKCEKRICIDQREKRVAIWRGEGVQGYRVAQCTLYTFMISSTLLLLLLTAYRS